MINVGNSGGPVLSENGGVVGIVTAKSVPLLQEIDHLRDILRTIPQFPSEVGIGTIDISQFVNLTTQALFRAVRLTVLVVTGMPSPFHGGVLQAPAERVNKRNFASQIDMTYNLVYNHMSSIVHNLFNPQNASFP